MVRENTCITVLKKHVTAIHETQQSGPNLSPITTSILPLSPGEPLKAKIDAVAEISFRHYVRLHG